MSRLLCEIPPVPDVRPVISSVMQPPASPYNDSTVAPAAPCSTLERLLQRLQLGSAHLPSFCFPTCFAMRRRPQIQALSASPRWPALQQQARSRRAPP